MPFPTKIQPIVCHNPKESIRNDPVKPVVKSRLKRLFERQFSSVLRISSAEKLAVDEAEYNKDANNDWEPSSVCLAKMVQNFIEESNEKQSAAAAKCGRNRCNCFNGNCSDSSDDEFDLCNGFGDSMMAASSGEACEILKSLVPCTNTAEKNLLADTAKIVEKNKSCKVKEDCRKIVIEGLLALGYDASICKSRWEKSPSYPAGEYEYVDVIVEGDRLLVDVDFRSEFEIARSTKNYRSVLQYLPSIFVGKPDRLQQIVSIVADALKQSLKKKGMHFPPWRKSEYMRAKWLSPYIRSNELTETKIEAESENNPSLIDTTDFSGELELIFGEKISPSATDSGKSSSFPVGTSDEEKKTTAVTSEWQPPAIKPKTSMRGAKIVTVTVPRTQTKGSANANEGDDEKRERESDDGMLVPSRTPCGKIQPHKICVIFSFPQMIKPWKLQRGRCSKAKVEKGRTKLPEQEWPVNRSRQTTVLFLPITGKPPFFLSTSIIPSDDASERSVQ